jgi:hypothetical protein
MLRKPNRLLDSPAESHIETPSTKEQRMGTTHPFQSSTPAPTNQISHTLALDSVPRRNGSGWLMEGQACVELQLTSTGFDAPTEYIVHPGCEDDSSTSYASYATPAFNH